MSTFLDQLTKERLHAERRLPSAAPGLMTGQAGLLYLISDVIEREGQQELASYSPFALLERQRHLFSNNPEETGRAFPKE